MKCITTGRLILLTICICLNNFSFSQNYMRYHSLCNQACQTVENGQIEQSYFLLMEAFRLVDYPKAADYLNMAKCYSQMNEPDSTKKYLLWAIERNPRIKKSIKMHRLWFEPVLGMDGWERITQKLEEQYVLSEGAKRVCDELNQIDSINLQFYRNYQKQEDLYKPMDTLLYNQYWDSVYQMTLVNASKLDSILLSLPNELLTNPIVEESFLVLSAVLQKEYWNPRKEMYLQLIDRGFMTPDILTSLFVEEHYGKEQIINYLSYAPRELKFCDKYGLIYDHFMYSFRVLNHWKYDEKEE